MREEDAMVLREIQKNTEMAMKAINTLASKVYDDGLALQLSRESLQYSKIRNKAVEQMVQNEQEIYPGNALQDMMLVGGIHTNTLLNTSTSHLAEMMIQGSNRGLTHMWKSLNQHENISDMSVEIANELMDFEEKNINRLKKYL